MHVSSHPIHNEAATFPGGCLLVDHLVLGQSAMVPQKSGKMVTAWLVRVTIFVDNYSIFLYVHHAWLVWMVQKRLVAKLAFECLVLAHGVVVCAYWANNDRFSNSMFQENNIVNNQTITCFGVGAHHQNGIAKRHICTLTDATRAVLLHGICMWPEALSISF